MATQEIDASKNGKELSASSVTNLPLDHTSNNSVSKSDGSTWDILLAFAIVSIPLTVLSAALLAVIFAFRVTEFQTVSGTNSEDNAYYVNLSATTVTLIASYSSTAASLVVGFAMTLISYTIATNIIRESERNRVENLPNPYQIALLITMQSGSLGALWPWMKYSFTNKFKRTAGVVKVLALTALSVVLLTYISCREILIW
jgi:hypothetical protein